MEELTPLQLAVKAAYKKLVMDCDGPTNAAKLTDSQPSHILEACSPNWPRMPRADHISILEASCGQLIVTGFMADLHGYDIELREHKAGDLGTAFASALKEIGEASSAVALSTAKGKLDEVTKQRNIRELTEARDAIERLITTARAA